jgi:LytS/YehU family sensor histidine kinase
LELYMKTEAMRFEQQFTYDIQVGESIDPDDTLVPTMILQPFVENAIWHGLSRKAGPGKVQIRFEKAGEMLVCSVEDNGGGRPSAALQKADGHESKALGITERRLQLLGDETGTRPFYTIIDLKDGLGNAFAIPGRLTWYSRFEFM